MKLLNSSFLLYVVLIAFPGEAYRILGLFPLNVKSHFAMFGRLMEGLAERGHRVDVVSHFPLEKPLPNYNDVAILTGTLPDLVNNVTFELIQRMLDTSSNAENMAYLFGNEVCGLMEHPELSKLIQNPPVNPAYDLIIVEMFGANCYLAMGQHLKVPVVGAISGLIFPWVNDFIANPDNPAYIPNAFSDFQGGMNFWQRVQNAVNNFKEKWAFHRASEEQTEAIKKYIGPHAPSVREAERNVSLILVNSHHTLNGVRPLTTAVVEVGGLHIDDRGSTLPDELQKWLDGSKDGFVYVSFGSMIKVESFPKEILSAIYASLAKLAPVRILMKIAKPEEMPPSLPSNVFIYQWIPQLAVLKHKNIRAFMTHGGLMGTQEAIYYGVPMIGIPFFGDQGQNIKRCTRMNFAVAVDYDTLTEKKLDAAFRKVLHDPSYMQAAKRMSALFRDRPMSPMDTAIFWIEYVIRHGGTNLRSPAMDLTWWQISLCDVYGFLFLTVVLVVCFVIVIVKKLATVFHPSRSKRTPKSMKVS